MKKDLTVLLVDDDRITVFLTQKLISGFEIKELVCKENGKAGIDYLVARKDASLELPDIVLLDLNMPVLDGWGFLEAFSESCCADNPKVAIYICSSSDAPTDILRAKTYPFVRQFITKPLTPKIFSEVLTNAVNHKV